MGTASSFLGKILPQFGRKDQSENNFVWRAEDTQHKDVIGKGSIGYVIEAINLKNGQTCAIKIIEYEKREDSIFEYAQKKAKLLSNLSKLKHPNILKVYNCEPIEVENNFALKHKYAFMMELNSWNLANVIQQKQNEKSLFEEADLLVNLLQLVGALNEAVKIGIHHHSIKEENIFYEKESQKMILGDFDLYENTASKPLDSIYKPPELASESNNLEPTPYNEKSDIYSLGIVFLKLALLWEGPTSKDKIPMYLELLKERNYKKLHHLLSPMLDLNLSKRPTLEELFRNTQTQICELKGYDYFDEKFSSNYLLENQKQIKRMLEDSNMCRLAEDHKRGITNYQKVINAFVENDPLSNKYDKYLLSVAHEGLSACYLEAKDFPMAVRHIFKCLKIKTIYLDGFKTYLTLMQVGKIYSRLGDFQNALIYYMKSNEDLKSVANSDALTLVKSKENIAYAFENLGDLQNACENYIQASALVQLNFGINNIKYVNNMKALVRIFKKKGEDDKVRLFENKIREIRI